nr:uncharacterized protein LOC109737639 isoform X2 [Aegilops tauschii subsp. strangulata]
MEFLMQQINSRTPLEEVNDSDIPITYGAPALGASCRPRRRQLWTPRSVLRSRLQSQRRETRHRHLSNPYIRLTPKVLGGCEGISLCTRI